MKLGRAPHSLSLTIAHLSQLLNFPLRLYLAHHPSSPTHIFHSLSLIGSLLRTHNPPLYLAHYSIYLTHYSSPIATDSLFATHTPSLSHPLTHHPHRNPSPFLLERRASPPQTSLSSCPAKPKDNPHNDGNFKPSDLHNNSRCNMA